MRLSDVNKLKEEIRKVLEEHEEILVSYLYGSAVRGNRGKTSDLDVGLLLKAGFRGDALYPARIAGEIKRKCRLDREVDIRILNNRSYRFLHQVIKNGEVMMSRNEKERVKFETSVIDGYIDFKPFHEQYDKQRMERLLGCA